MALFRLVSWERIVLNCVIRGPSFMLLIEFSHTAVQFSSLDMQWKQLQLGYAITLSFNNLLVFRNVNLQNEDILPLDLFCKEFSCSLYSAWTFWCRGKRPASTTNGASNAAAKKGRGAGGLQNQLVNRALEGLSHGGRSGIRGRGRGWGGRGRGRSHW